MKRSAHYLLQVVFAVSAILFSDRAEAQRVPRPDEVLSLIRKVNDYWQTNNKPDVRAFWDPAAYHTGNMAAYQVTQEPRYLAYSLSWADHNKWMGAKGQESSKWKYTYGETEDFVLFGDWQACFQTYIDLYHLDPQPYKISRVKEVIDYQVTTKPNDYWWWADGLYMAMPVFTKLYLLTGDRKYLQKLEAYFHYADSLLYDSSSGLYYRDRKYIYPAHKSINGKKDFWARGNGWVFAALAKVVQDIPEKDPSRQIFLKRYLRMAKALKRCQQTEGYWTRSLVDAAHAPGPETSGTAFFTYGYLWGINHGVLKKKAYSGTALKAWRYLTNTALQPDGRLGYVQPIGEKAIPGQVVNAHSTANFGVGAFLLGAAEMYRYSQNNFTDHK